tara:strand:- start:38249 stop:38455 length:207 start_codon:yes stop_codon:yes gene_type:complete
VVIQVLGQKPFNHQDTKNEKYKSSYYLLFIISSLAFLGVLGGASRLVNIWVLSPKQFKHQDWKYTFCI